MKKAAKLISLSGLAKLINESSNLLKIYTGFKTNEIIKTLQEAGIEVLGALGQSRDRLIVINKSDRSKVKSILNLEELDFDESKRLKQIK